MQTGAHERMMVTPLSMPAMVIGWSLKEMVPLVVQALIIIAAVLPFGFRLYRARANLLTYIIDLRHGQLNPFLPCTIRMYVWSRRG